MKTERQIKNALRRLKAQRRERNSITIALCIASMETALMWVTGQMDLDLVEHLKGLADMEKAGRATARKMTKGR